MEEAGEGVGILRPHGKFPVESRGEALRKLSVCVSSILPRGPQDLFLVFIQPVCSVGKDLFKKNSF